jgi:hypothetical protein
MHDVMAIVLNQLCSSVQLYLFLFSLNFKTHFDFYFVYENPFIEIKKSFNHFLIRKKLFYSDTLLTHNTLARACSTHTRMHIRKSPRILLFSLYTLFKNFRIKNFQK